MAITVEEFKNAYDWSSAWGVSSQAPKANHYTMDDIAEVLAADEGENDEQNWVALLKMNDGNVVFLDAGCDYTGWDCQANGFIDVNTLEYWMGPLGLEPVTRERLFPRE